MVAYFQLSIYLQPRRLLGGLLLLDCWLSTHRRLPSTLEYKCNKAISLDIRQTRLQWHILLACLHSAIHNVFETGQKRVVIWGRVMLMYQNKNGPAMTLASYGRQCFERTFAWPNSVPCIYHLSVEKEGTIGWLGILGSFQDSPHFFIRESFLNGKFKMPVR